MIKSTDRISLPYFRGMFAPTKREPYTNMFVEDFQNIVPIYDRENKIKCYLTPVDQDFEKILMELLPSVHGYNNRSFTEVVLNSILFIARYLVDSGQVILEFTTKVDLNEELNYELVSVRGDEIKVEGEKVIQVITPKPDLQLFNTEIKEIPRDKCYLIEFPESLGGASTLLDFVKKVGEMGEEFNNIGFFNNPLNNTKGYDWQEHHNAYETTFWRYTKTYHWHHRSLSRDKLSSYYDIYRRLMFRKNQLILRDHIIKELCLIITDIALKFEKRVELKIEGLLTISDIDLALEIWKKGTPSPDYITKVLK